MSRGDETSKPRRGFLRGWREHLEDDEELSLDLDVDFSEHIEAIRVSLDSFVADARKAGLDTPVPTTPDWNVRQLIAHQGMVHRWATDNVLGRRGDTHRRTSPRGSRRTTPSCGCGPVATGSSRHCRRRPSTSTHRSSSTTRRRRRLFWARRQCHETTIHSVDALAASLGPDADRRRRPG